MTVEFYQDHKFLFKHAKKSVKKFLPRSKQITVVLFIDLTNSVLNKMKIGSSNAISQTLFHNKICKLIIEYNGGKVITEVGDAVIAVFASLTTACDCALNIIYNFKKYDDTIATKASISVGSVEIVTVGKSTAIYGLPVDLCARMMRRVCKNSIILEESNYSEISQFINKKYIEVKKPHIADLKSFGNIRLREIRPFFRKTLYSSSKKVSV